MTIPTAPIPLNEPIRTYAPGSSERASLEARLRTLAPEPLEIASVVGGRDVPPAGSPTPSRRTTTTASWRASTRAGRPRRRPRSPRRPRPGRPGRARRGRSAPPSSCAPPTCWAGRGATRSTPRRCSDRARRASGRDRRGLRADRLPALQRRTSRERLSPSSRSPARGDVEPHRLPAARGLRVAVTPFNFTAIAGNLPTAPALMGNTVVWKPASPAIALGALRPCSCCRRPDCPTGVINFVYGAGGRGRRRACSTHRDSRACTSRARPRCSRASGGRSASASPLPQLSAHRRRDRRQGLRLRAPLAPTSTRGRRRSCAAPSSTRARSARPPRALYVPRSAVARAARPARGRRSAQIRWATSPTSRNFMGAVIDERAFARHRATRSREASATAARSWPAAAPTTPGLVRRADARRDRRPRLPPDERRAFGPVLTVYVYDDADWDETLDLVDRDSPYALTGAVFAQRPRGASRRRPTPALRRRQLLRERQAHRRRGRPAAVRRRRAPPARTTRPARSGTSRAGRARG